MELIENLTEILESLYGKDKKVIAKQLNRYVKLLDSFNDKFPQNEVYLFSTPGRTEISGNHTDHNLGRVIAASVNLDSIAVVSKNDSKKITIYSKGYSEPFEVSLESLSKIRQEEGTTNSLIRGIAARLVELNYNIGGFNCVMTSDVLPGSGLSSSASVEVLIGNIFNSLFNDGEIKNEDLAVIGQWAENNYFGKPCGLMDQMACAVGGIIAIDFKNPNNPQIEKVNFNLESHGYKMLIVDTGGNHKDLTEDYSSIPAEMKSVAKVLNKNVLRDVETDLFFSNLKVIRKKVGDRAALRAFHFITENERVVKQIELLRKNDFPMFLKYVNDSGSSSFKWLQNIYSTKNIKEQSIAVSLALTERFIGEKGEGACRVHGGGFAGTIQVFLPGKYVEEYKNYIESVLGKGTVMVLQIRSQGSICLN